MWSEYERVRVVNENIARSSIFIASSEYIKFNVKQSHEFIGIVLDSYFLEMIISFSGVIMQPLLFNAQSDLGVIYGSR
jgi:hypothetical protein